jgi:FtsZ-interacting cell division protein ZipA
VIPVALTQADAAAWVCFGVGIVVLACGLVVGLWTSLKRAPATAARKAADAKAKLDDAKEKITEAQTRIEQTSSEMRRGGLEDFTAAAPAATEALTAAVQSAEGAKTAFEQVEGIVASLPQNLRFAGLLVLVGTVLIGVATIQFGGVSLF